MAGKSTFRPIRRSDGPCGLMAVTFCALSYYGEEPASEAGIPPRPPPPVAKPFFAATAFGFRCSILAQPSAFPTTSGRFTPLWDRGSVTAVPMQTRNERSPKSQSGLSVAERRLGSEGNTAATRLPRWPRRGGTCQACGGTAGADSTLRIVRVRGAVGGVGPPARPWSANATDKR
jgi:hypothetical protein